MNYSFKLKDFAQGEGGEVVGKVWKFSIYWNIFLICSLGPTKIFYFCHPLSCICFVLPWREVPHVYWIFCEHWSIFQLIPTQHTSPVDKITKYQHSNSKRFQITFSIDKQNELSWNRLKVNAMVFGGDASSKIKSWKDLLWTICF